MAQTPQRVAGILGPHTGLVGEMRWGWPVDDERDLEEFDDD